MTGWKDGNGSDRRGHLVVLLGTHTYSTSRKLLFQTFFVPFSRKLHCPMPDALRTTVLVKASYPSRLSYLFGPHVSI